MPKVPPAQLVSDASSWLSKARKRALLPSDGLNKSIVDWQLKQRDYLVSTVSLLGLFCSGLVGEWLGWFSFSFARLLIAFSLALATYYLCLFLLSRNVVREALDDFILGGNHNRADTRLEELLKKRERFLLRAHERKRILKRTRGLNKYPRLITNTGVVVSAKYEEELSLLMGVLESGKKVDTPGLILLERLLTDYRGPFYLFVDLNALAEILRVIRLELNPPTE